MHPSTRRNYFGNTHSFSQPMQVTQPSASSSIPHSPLPTLHKASHPEHWHHLLEEGAQQYLEKLSSSTNEQEIDCAIHEFAKRAPLSADFFNTMASKRFGPPNYVGPPYKIIFERGFFTILQTVEGKEFINSFIECCKNLENRHREQQELVQLGQVAHQVAQEYAHDQKKCAAVFKEKLSAFHVDLGSIYYQLWVLDNKPNGDPDYAYNKVLNYPSILLTYRGHQPIQERLSSLELETITYFEEFFKKIHQRPLSERVHHLREQITPKLPPTAEDRAIVAKLQTLHEALDGKKACHERFFALSSELQNHFAKLVWEANYRNDENDPNFGRNTILKNPFCLATMIHPETGNSLIRQVLCEVLSSGASPATIESLQNLDWALDGRDTCLRAFKALPRSIQNTFYGLVWLANDRQDDGDYEFGRNTVERNPFVLGRIVDHQTGETIVQQVIRFLEKASSSTLAQAVEQVQRVPGNTSTIRPRISAMRFSETSVGAFVPEQRKIAMVSAEFEKLAKSGGLGPAVYGMTEGLAKAGDKVRVVLPFYSCLPKEIRDKIKSKEIKEKKKYEITDPLLKPCRIWKAKMKDLTESFPQNGHGQDAKWKKNVSFYFIEDTHPNRPGFHHDRFFCKEIYQPKESNGGNPIGESERFAYFQTTAAELMHKFYNTYSKKDGRNKVEVVHHHDWSSGLLSKLYSIRHSKEWTTHDRPSFVYTVHNNQHQGHACNQVLGQLGPEYMGLRNPMLEGLKYADHVTTVSPNFAQEVQIRSSISFDLHEEFSKLAHNDKLSGVLNGTNATLFDPKTDLQLRNWKDPETGQAIDLTYGPDDDDILQKKELIGQQLQKHFTKYHPDRKIDFSKPLVLSLGRFADQKGLDMLEPTTSTILANGGQLLVIGPEDSQDPITETQLNKFEQKIRKHWPAGVVLLRDPKVKGKLLYQQGSDHRSGIGSLLRACATFFYLPSKFEPCGLTQTEARQFGTLYVIGTKTGGLADTEETSGENRTAVLVDRVDDRIEQAEKFQEGIQEAFDIYWNLSEEEQKRLTQHHMRSANNQGWNSPQRNGDPSSIDQMRLVHTASIMKPPLSRNEPSVPLQINGFRGFFA